MISSTRLCCSQMAEMEHPKELHELAPHRHGNRCTSTEFCCSFQRDDLANGTEHPPLHSMGAISRRYDFRRPLLPPSLTRFHSILGYRHIINYHLEYLLWNSGIDEIYFELVRGSNPQKSGSSILYTQSNYKAYSTNQ